MKYKSYLVERDDISQLCLKLGQWVDHLNPTAANFRFILHHIDTVSGLTSRDNISSYKKFTDFDWSGTKPIKSIEVYFDFAVGNDEPAGGISAYSINVDLHGVCLAKDELNAMVGREYWLGGGEPTLDIRIEYVDYLVARNLEMVVNDWFDGLEERTVPSPPNWMPRFDDRRVAFGNGTWAVNYFTRFRALATVPIFAVLLVGEGLWWELSTSLFTNWSFWLAVLILSTAYTLLVHIIFVRINNFAWPRGYFPALNLNEASKRRYQRHQEILEKGKGYARELAYTITTGAVGSLVASSVIGFWRVIDMFN